MKKEEKTGLTKERILLAAMEEFGEKGYAAASLNNICAAGIPKGLLYHNYESKDALYLACVKQSFSVLMNCLQEKGGDGGLQEYMEARLLFFRENKKEARLFFETLLQPPAALSEQITELKKEFDEWNRSKMRKEPREPLDRDHLLLFRTLCAPHNLQRAVSQLGMPQATASRSSRRWRP